MRAQLAFDVAHFKRRDLRRRRSLDSELNVPHSLLPFRALRRVFQPIAGSASAISAKRLAR